MYILKNALTSIVRNKGRNLLIGIIVMVISCSVAVMLAINNSSNSLIKAYEKKYEVEATISINRENIMKDFNPQEREKSKESIKDIFNEINNITDDDVKKYADSNYVKNYYYTKSIGVNSNTLEKAEVTSNKGFSFGQGPERENFNTQTTGDFTLKGYSQVDAMQEFIDGAYKITSGEVFTDFDSNNCIINTSLATLNDIKVGDTIKVVDSTDEEKEYELVVSGIYEEKETDQENKMNMFSQNVNTIITNVNFINKILDNNTELTANISPTFILKEKNVVEKFTSELKTKGLNENLTVETNLDMIDSATTTISNVKTFATAFLIITLVIGTIVLLIINMINIRERKYEIGVLRTIGMKKHKVCFQFVSELFMISIISLLLGASIGAMISVPVSNKLLQNEISTSQNETKNIRENFGKPNGNFAPPGSSQQFTKNFRGVTKVEKFTKIDAVVDLKVLLELIVLGLIITLISSMSAVMSIQKFSPLAILKERT